MSKKENTENKSYSPDTYHHGDLKNALIKAGLSIIIEEGIDALSLREVARRIGVSHAAPYRHFENKEALLSAIAADSGGKMVQEMEAIVSNHSNDYRAQFVEMSWIFVHFGFVSPDQLGIVLGRQSGEECRYIKYLKEAFGLFENTIRQGQKVGILKNSDPQTIALSMWSMVYGLVALVMNNQVLPSEILDTVSNEALARKCIQVLLEGIEK